MAKNKVTTVCEQQEQKQYDFAFFPNKIIVFIVIQKKVINMLSTTAEILYLNRTQKRNKALSILNSAVN